MVTTTQERRIQTMCLMVLAFTALGGALYYLRPVLIPFVLALFFTYCLTPLIDFQIQRLRFHRYVALTSTLLLGFGLLALISAYVSSSVAQLASQADEYQSKIIAIRDIMLRELPVEELGLKQENFAGTLLVDSRVGDALSSVLNAILSLLSNGVMVMIFMFFMLLGARGKPHKGLLGDIEESIKAYIIQKVLISAVTGLVHGLILWSLGVPFPVVFAVLAFLLNFIPNLGPVAATFLHLPVLFFGTDLSTTWVILGIALPGAIQILSGNVVEPHIMGESLDLHPVVVVLALIFFGMIWGIVGMFLATPIAAVLKLLFERLEFTRPAAAIMAGRLASAGLAPLSTPRPPLSNYQPVEPATIPLKHIPGDGARVAGTPEPPTVGNLPEDPSETMQSVSASSLRRAIAEEVAREVAATRGAATPSEGGATTDDDAPDGVPTT